MKLRLNLSTFLFIFIFFILIVLVILSYQRKIIINLTPSFVDSKLTIIPTLPKQEYSIVTAIIDGDTISIEGNKKVRYIGINTPETVDPRKKSECFGKEASMKNKELVLGKSVILKKDVSEVDRYGRLLRYVWLTDPNNATSEGIFVNDYLVRQGYAQVSTFPPDIKYVNQFIEAEHEARNNNRGLWSKCQ